MIIKDIFFSSIEYEVQQYKRLPRLFDELEWTPLPPASNVKEVIRRHLEKKK